MTAAATMTPITTLGRPLLFLDVSLAVLFALLAVWVIIVVGRVDEEVEVATTGGGVVTTSAVVRVDADELVERVLLVVVLVERVLVDRVEVDRVVVVGCSSPIPPKIPERIMEIMSPPLSAGSGVTGVGVARICLA